VIKLEVLTWLDGPAALATDYVLWHSRPPVPRADWPAEHRIDDRCRRAATLDLVALANPGEARPMPRSG